MRCIALGASALNDALGLREEPDTDTITALRRSASLETFSGNHDEANRLATEALALGQALGVDTREVAPLFNASGLAARFGDRLLEAACWYREAARLAERAGDYGMLGTAQNNLVDVLVRSDPQAAAEAARSAVAHDRRTGQRDGLGVAWSPSPWR